MPALFEQLKIELPAPMKVCYAEKFSVTDSGRYARPLMQKLGEIGLSRGVFQEPEKSQYVRPERVPEAAAKLATIGTTLKHKAGARGLGGYIGSPQVQDAWVKAQVYDWAHRVTALGKIMRRFPHTTYNGLVK